MFKSEYSQRAAELNIAATSTRSASRWRILMLAALAAGIYLWSREAFIAAPTTVTLPSRSSSVEADIDWYGVLTDIDQLRNQALQNRDAGLLALAVDKSGPAFTAESEVVSQLIADDLRISGLKYVVLAVQERFRRWTGAQEFVELAVRDRRDAYEQTSADGRSTTVPARPEREWNVTLMRSGPHSDWRLWQVASAAEDLGSNNVLN